MDLKETDILGPDIEQHWYYRSKARAMLHMLKGFSASTLLDVGAGSGFFPSPADPYRNGPGLVRGHQLSGRLRRQHRR